MASAPIYCTHIEFKRVFPQLDEYDQKTPIYGWESLGNNVYVAHDTGLITQLFQDGKELSPAVTASDEKYKTKITHSLGIAGSGLTYNTIGYNAGAFTEGDEDDIRVGDYIKITKTAASGVYEYCFIESINTGANQITVRRGALGTTVISWLAGGDDLFFEEDINVTDATQWHYDSYFDQTLVYSASNPSDLLMEAGEDFTTMVTQFRTDASRYLDSRLDPKLPKSQWKNTAGEFDYIIVRVTSLIAATFMIRTKDPSSELTTSFEQEYENIIELLNEGRESLGFQNTGDASMGIIRDLTYTAGSLRPVDLKGRAGAVDFDLIKVKVIAGGNGLGTDTYSVWTKDGDQLKNNQVVTAEKISGDYQPLAYGLQIRFGGDADADASAANDEWEVEVRGYNEEVDTSDLKGLKMTRSRYY